MIICSHCQAQNENCQVCHGWRVVLPLSGKVLYWQKKLSPIIIYNNKILKLIRKIIDALLYIFVIVVFVLTLYFLYNYLQAGGEMVNFFLKKHFILKLFWLACLIGLYIFYRISKEKVSEKGVVKKYENNGMDPDWNLPRTTIRGRDDNLDQDDIWQLNSIIEKVNIAKAFSFKALDLIEKSYLLSNKLNQELEPIHILYKLLEEKEIKAYFFRLGVNVTELRQRIENVFLKMDNVETPRRGVSTEAIELFLLAYEETYNSSQSSVGLEEILVSLVKQKSIVQEILYDLEIDENKLKNIIAWARIQKKIAKYWRGLEARAKNKPKGEVNRSYTAVASPYLDQFSEDLTHFAKAGLIEPGIGKEKELKQIFNYFNAGKSGVILVGEPGCGKSFVVDAMAELMAAEQVPEILKDKRLVRLSVPALIAGADAPGATEQRLLFILKEVKRAGNIILAIDNIESLVGLGTETSKSLDLAEALSSELEKDYFLLIAVCDLEKYNLYLKNSSLGQTLAKVEVKEPDRNQAIRILESKSPFFETKYNVYFSYQAIEAAVDFSRKYIKNKFLPLKAVDLMEATAQFTRQQKGERQMVQAEEVLQVVSEITKIPVTKVSKLESDKLLDLEQEMHRRIIDQNEAVKKIAEALRRARANLREEKRPIASFLFLGPTGVGKTEVARALADIYFGGEQNIIRLDMSEYNAALGVQKLIGFEGDVVSGYLTSLVCERPFAIVLLDEFEKASDEVHNLFLQVLEDGRLTDAQGKTADFTNTIIIGTSNAGSIFIQENLKNGRDIKIIEQELIDQELNQYFKPELLNRFDGVIVFKPLSIIEVEQITGLLLNKLIKNLADKGIELKYTEYTVKQIARAGFDPGLGARPLRRVIQDKIENQLANLILSKKIERRDKVILNGLEEIKIEKAISI